MKKEDIERNPEHLGSGGSGVKAGGTGFRMCKVLGLGCSGMNRLSGSSYPTTIRYVGLQDQ